MSPPPVIDPAREELVYQAGDAPDPAARFAPGGTELARGQGYQSSIKLTAGAIGHPLVRYGEQVLELDVFEPTDGVPHILLICPKCRNQLRIPADRKAYEYDPLHKDYIAVGGRINVEPFSCTWELENEGRRMEFGLGLCGWRVGIIDNVARAA